MNRMKLTIHIAETIRCVLKDIPNCVVIEKHEPTSISQLAADIGVPPILVVFASVDGMRKEVNTVVTEDAKIHLFGSMAGG